MPSDEHLNNRYDAETMFRSFHRPNYNQNRLDSRKYNRNNCFSTQTTAQCQRLIFQFTFSLYSKCIRLSH